MTYGALVRSPHRVGLVAPSSCASSWGRRLASSPGQAITLDQFHEASWRLALQAKHALGLRESITRRYDELTRSLYEQIGLEPTRETRLMYRQLLGQS